MMTLGIESTAHTLSMGVSRKGKVLSNVIDMYRVGKEGMIPRDLADHHARVFGDVLRKSLDEADVTMDDVGLIAFSQGPGIGAPLAIGTAGAKFLASRYGKELIGVNHCYAHVKISEHLCKMKAPLILYLSGGNSQILQGDGGYYQVLGETLDIGLGNLFDSFARAIGMKHAHGSELEKLSRGGNYVELPYSVKGMNLVFSGLLTHAERLAGKHSKKDLAFSLMETSFAMTCEVTERALFLTRKKNLVVCGGVAQNRRLQHMLKTMCDEDGVRFEVAPDEYNRDNGAMIAYAGEVQRRRFGTKPVEQWNQITNYRIDRMKEVLTS